MNTPSDRYDRLTRLFHWLTAAVVIFMFASAHIWEHLEKGTPLRKGLQSVHISLGIAMAVLIAVRICWRLFGGSRLAAGNHPALNRLAKMAHGCLYLLLLAQIVLGFLFRWAQGEPFNFFGLLPIPAPLVIDHAWRGTLGGLHDKVAWAIIVLAGLHAAAALWHHYVKGDGTLRRMLPGPRNAFQKSCLLLCPPIVTEQDNHEQSPRTRHWLPQRALLRRLPGRRFARRERPGLR